MDKVLKVINILCIIIPILLYYVLKINVSPAFFVYMLIPLIYIQIKKGISYTIKTFVIFLLSVIVAITISYFISWINIHNVLNLLFDVINLTIASSITMFLIDSLTKENEYLEHAIMEDSLTNLFNKRYFMLKFNQEINNHIKNKKSLCLLMIDLDYFKHCNDNCGHPIGDLILKQFAQILCNSIRKSDIAARYGGEEFSIMLPNTNVKDALLIAERIRTDVEKFEFDIGNVNDKPCVKCKKTVSIGMAYLDCTYKNAEQLIDRADEALYEAKINRNQVSIWEK